MPRLSRPKYLVTLVVVLTMTFGATTPVGADDSAAEISQDVVIRLEDAADGRPVFLSATVTDEVAAALEAHPIVQDVEAVAGGTILGDPEFERQNEHTASGFAPVWDHTTGSSDVVIAVLDTGVSPNADLGGRLLAGASFVGGDPQVDNHGHGTGVALVAAAGLDNDIGGVGTCPSCSILPVQVADANGSVRWDHAAEGILWAVDQGADVINLSFGGTSGAGVLRDSIRYATDSGVIVLAAAGNSGNTTQFYPAAYDGAISVGGHDAGGNRYSFSNHGDWVDVAAPGCVWVTIEAAATACGTSYASPYTAGAAAILLAAGLDVDEATTIVTSDTRPVAWTDRGLLDGAHVLAELERLFPAEPAEPTPADEPTVRSDSRAEFSDVAANAYYANAVAWLSENGISTGTTPTTFSPDQPLTRAQAATLLWRNEGQP